MPDPVSTAAASSANSADRCRASQPSTTPAWAAVGQYSCSQRARPMVAARTTARFIRFGPAPIAPRRPAVPNSSRPANRSASSARAAWPGALG